MNARPTALMTVLLAIAASLMMTIPASAAQPAARGDDVQIASSQFVAPITQFETEVMWTMPPQGVVVGGLAMADVLTDAAHPGNEILGCDDFGRLVVCYRQSGAWASQVLWTSQGQLMTPVAGDFDPFHAGPEILVVGMTVGPESDSGAGSATEVYQDSSGVWNAREVYRGERMLHGAVVGDLDPDRAGMELVVVGFNGEVTMLTPVETGNWTVERLWTADGKARKTVIDDFDADHIGNELVVVDKKGNVTEIFREDGAWTATHMWKDPGTPGVSRVAVGDCDSDRPGKEVVVGGDSSNVAVLWKESGAWKGEIIFTDTDKIRGTAIGDFDATAAGNELLTFGYSANLTVHRKAGGVWVHRQVAQDSARGHDLVLGEFDADHPGLEAVFCGYSRNITEVKLSQWVGEQALSDKSAPNGIMGIAVGDADPKSAGNEVVAVDDYGQVILARRAATGWTSQVLWKGEGQLITPVIADFDPFHAGTEILVVGMTTGPEADSGPGSATEIYQDSAGVWQAREVYRGERMLHGAAAGDLDPDREGLELVVTGFNGEVTLITPTETGNWTVERLWTADGKARKAVIDDFDADHEGAEMVVVDKKGNATEIYKQDGAWTAVHMWTDPGTPGISRVNVGELWPDVAGKEIVVGGDSSNVGLIWKESGAWKGKVIFTDTDKIRGAIIADLDPAVAGSEIYSYGYATNVMQLVQSGGAWTAKKLISDNGRGHDLVLGDADSYVPGLELYFGGYSKNVTMASLMGQSPAAAVTASAQKAVLELDAGESATLTVDVSAQGGYVQQAQASVSGLPDGVTASVWPSVFSPPAALRLNVTAAWSVKDGSAKISVDIMHGGVKTSLPVTVNLTADVSTPALVEGAEEPVYDPASGIRLAFSEDIDEASIEDAGLAVETEDGDEVQFVWAYDPATRTIVITNLTDGDGKAIADGMGMTVTTVAPLKDRAGNAMGGPLAVDFVMPGEKEDVGVSTTAAVVLVVIVLVVVVVLFYLMMPKKTPPAQAAQKPAAKAAPKAADRPGATPAKKAPGAKAPRKGEKKKA